MYSAMEDKQKAKHQILYRLKVQGAQTATALAEQLQISPMAVRQHLQALQADGWVTYQEERRPMGRPVKLWQLQENAGEFFPDSHADLTVDLLQSIETVFGQQGVEKLLAERSQRQLQSYRQRLGPLVGLNGDWRQRVNAIAQLRNEEGYMAEAIPQSERTVLLVENHCPIRAAAQTCALFCRCELEVFQTLLGPMVKIERVEHIMAGDRRCAYQITLTQNA